MDKYPFRLGCTSYVYPADILYNVNKMAGLVDDIELVLFESEELSNLPSSDTICELRRIAEENSLTYSVHFPIDKKAGSINSEERKYFLEQICKIIDLTKGMPLSGYVLHLEGINKTACNEDRKNWELKICDFLEQLLKISLIPSNMFCLENLCYPVHWLQNMQKMFNMSSCMDIGHLLLYEPKWKELLLSFEDVKIVHLHGVHDGKDHLSLNKGKDGDIDWIFKNFIKSFKGVLTLEVFSKEDTFDSIEKVGDLWQKLY